ncbi:MAG: hypothetical protein ACXVII_41440 [Solirubrobacteraceae bacterium]
MKTNVFAGRSRCIVVGHVGVQALAVDELSSHLVVSKIAVAPPKAECPILALPATPDMLLLHTSKDRKEKCDLP